MRSEEWDNPSPGLMLALKSAYLAARIVGPRAVDLHQPLVSDRS
jgi:hypothetical protein